MMNKFSVKQKLASAFLALAVLAMPFSAGAQTRIPQSKNKYKTTDDVKLGREASQEAERQLPILRDSQITSYIQNVGNRLVDAIPTEYQQPDFQYTFKVVNQTDINAFALPGGPMYLNRGMIEAAKNEGEMAGVMAHEISHIALRHGTANATKQSSVGNQILGIGAILGGAILAGEAGAQLGALGVQAYFTKFSREYETQADVLGAQIMARAGYDPRDLANMFQTIQAQGGSRGTPEFLSSHPNPTNRYARINQEAALLRVSGTPIRNTSEFNNVKARLRGTPRASNTAGNNNSNTGNGGVYTRQVELPSTRYRTYNAQFLRVDVPNNWQEYGQNTSVMFAPEGAVGNNGITHGAIVGVEQGNTRANLQTATRNYVSGLLQQQENNYLRQQTNSRSFYEGIDGRNTIETVLAGRSPITGQTEVVTIYTTQLRDGSLFYVATVVPQNQSNSYSRAFGAMIRSIQLSD